MSAAATQAGEPAPAGPAASVHLLDGFRLRSAGREVDLPLGSQRMLAHLGLTARPTRSGLAGTLWPDVDESRAQSNLRSTLWRLHRTCPGLVVAHNGNLALHPDVQVDVHELARWARGILAPDSAPTEPDELPATLQGELLPGWYDDWILLEREHLTQLRLHALEVLAERLSHLGRYGNALEAAYAAMRAEPLRESAHRTVIRVHLAEGNTVDALRQYETFRQRLHHEIGAQPSRLMADLLRGVRRR